MKVKTLKQIAFNGEIVAGGQTIEMTEKEYSVYINDVKKVRKKFKKVVGEIKTK